ncbi:InlB B-repeat-containing protein, partial [Streptomyces scabiei]|uniref:InlB B-repeat-containing protein n=1 Tax=Streptomyces scabiei TaxID=1930 RepID=UPI0038F613DA
QYASGTTVTMTAIGTGGSAFLRWSGSCTGNSNVLVITITTSLNCTASFIKPNGVTVTLAGSGSGLITSSPAGLSCSLAT